MAKDDAWIAEALSGDPAAFEALVEAFWPVAERVARRMLGDAQLAQDVAQDVFADIYVQRARYQPRFAFHAYVSAIARHKSIGMLRKSVRCEALHEWLGTARTPEDEFVDRMFRGVLYARVERLPEMQRRVFVAYALEDRSYKEIAAALGLTVGQVKIMLHRVRTALRRARNEWND